MGFEGFLNLRDMYDIQSGMEYPRISGKLKDRSVADVTGGEVAEEVENELCKPDRKRKRNAIINPLKTCQPLGAKNCIPLLELEEQFPWSHGSQGCLPSLKIFTFTPF